MKTASAINSGNPQSAVCNLPAQDADVALMLRVQRDEPGAFAELVRRYWMRVFGRFYRQLGDRQEAEDLAQDVFLRMYGARKRYRPTAKFATWLFHISQNVARNAIRSRRRHPHLRIDLVHTATEEHAVEPFLRSRYEPPSWPMERAELAGLVRAAGSSLGRRQRAALELHQFHDRTYSQIAAEMDMTPKAAKSLLYRARLRLRAHLTKLLDLEM